MIKANKLESGLHVMFHDGRERDIIYVDRIADMVGHCRAGVGFGFCTKTPLAEFCNDVNRVTFRSSYDKR